MNNLSLTKKRSIKKALFHPNNKPYLRLISIIILRVITAIFLTNGRIAYPVIATVESGKEKRAIHFLQNVKCKMFLPITEYSVVNNREISWQISNFEICFAIGCEFPYGTTLFPTRK